MLLLATEVWRTHGGVQRYMMMIGRMLTDRCEHFALLTLLDGLEHGSTDVLANKATRCGGNKWRFCLQAFLMGFGGHGRVTVVGHLALLPLTWVLHTLGLVGKYAVVLHGTEAWQRIPWLSRIAARRATALVATTRYTMREFCYHNRIPTSKCFVIPLASNFSLPGIVNREPGSQLKILTVSRLSKADTYKGIDTVFLALRRGKDKGLNLKLDLVGSGNDMERLQVAARSLGVQELVNFRGSITDEELKGLFSESHVFVMPSKKEGFGIAYLEAMAAGLPCIGANHGGTPEVIQHGESGFLIEYGDSEQLAFYLSTILESGALYASLSKAARRRAANTLSFEVMAHSWDRLLDTMNDANSPIGNKPVAVETR